MPSRRRRARVGFAVFAVLVVLGLFVLSGAAVGADLFVAMLVFVAACSLALRDQDPDATAGSQRAGLTGWFGRWF